MTRSATLEKPAGATKSAKELISHLRETGTPPEVVERIEAFAEAEGCDVGTVLEWMIANDFTKGTVEKAGKLIHGATFSLTSPATVTTNDRISNLSQEVEELKRTIREQDARHVRLMNENRALRERNKQLMAAGDSERMTEAEKLTPKRGRRGAAAEASEDAPSEAPADAE